MTHEQFEKADRNLSVWRKTKMYVLPFYDKYDGFGSLKSIQVMGKAELIEPFF